VIRRLLRARIARKRVEVFKPVLDNRYSAEEISAFEKEAEPSASLGSREKGDIHDK